MQVLLLNRGFGSLWRCQTRPGVPQREYALGKVFL
jgi:hypothetical protein